MNAAVPRKLQIAPRGLPNPVCILLTIGIASAAFCGCQKKAQATEDGIAPPDPQTAANLATLSHDLRRAMPHYKLTGDFNEFAATAHIDVPPPPAGLKYAINKKWKVILVDAK